VLHQCTDFAEEASGSAAFGVSKALYLSGAHLAGQSSDCRLALEEGSTSRLKANSFDIAAPRAHFVVSVFFAESQSRKPLQEIR
jgi:hypothetical protein